MMIRRTGAALVVTLLLAVAPACAALSPGARAPLFTTQASMGGKVFSFSLADALKKGPVVLYFYPAAFTTGCTIEAHDFAEAIGRYKQLHATVIGVSHDTISVLNKFSVSACRSKFPVAADPSLVIAKHYDAVLPIAPTYANRTSYVIGQDGKIAYAYTDLKPDKHVENTLAALEKLEANR